MLRINKVVKGIVINDKEFKLGQYADDTQLFLNGTEQSLRASIKTLEHFYKMSGLKINVDKTKAVWIGEMAHSDLQICRDIKLDWSKGPFKILGVNFTASVFDIWDFNTEVSMLKIEQTLKSWRKRKLTLFGRMHIIKSLALSKLIHLFIALPNPPDELIKKLERMFFLNFFGTMGQIKLKGQ